jgi:hypothetical protein
MTGWVKKLNKQILQTMIIYNVTVNVSEDIHDEWLKWMTTEHIKDVMDTGCFKDSKIYRVVSPEPEEGVTYSILYYLNSIEEYERYQIEHAAILQSQNREKFEGEFTAYRTLMESI